MFEEEHTERTLLKQVVGAAVLEYMRKYEPQSLFLELDSEATKILRKIQTILDDETLDDPACFKKLRQLYQHSTGTEFPLPDMILAERKNSTPSIKAACCFLWDRVTLSPPAGP